jgi:hypothetical protein
LSSQNVRRAIPVAAPDALPRMNEEAGRTKTTRPVSSKDRRNQFHREIAASVDGYLPEVLQRDLTRVPV